MGTDEMTERTDVLEGMRLLCKENYDISMKMAEDLKGMSIANDTRPFAEQRRYSELAFTQLHAYLKAMGWYGAVPEDDEAKGAAMREHIVKGVPIEP